MRLLKYVLLILAIQAGNIFQPVLATNIVIENQEFRLIITADAKAKSLIYKPTKRECLYLNSEAPLFSITQYTPYDNELQLTYPAKSKTFNANGVKRVGNDLIVSFDLLNIKAKIELNITSNYIGFSVKEFLYAIPKFGDTRKTQIDEFTLLQLPIRKMTNFGEWLNVVWDNDIAVNLLATDSYAKIDANKHKDHYLLQAGTLNDIKNIGVGAALIVTKKNNLLDRIENIENDYRLPKGVKSRRSEAYQYSYLELKNVTLKNIDEYIGYAKKGGFKAIQIVWSDFAKTMGHFPWRPEYPNGMNDLKAIVFKIKQAGIIPGIHIHYNKANKNDLYVSPVPDYRLNLRSIFTLSTALTEEQTIITVEENPANSTLDDERRILKMGEELIAYESYTTTRPYQFKGCKRGILHSKTSAYQAGLKFGLLDVDTWDIFVRFDQKTSIQQEVANRISKIYKDAGFEFVYFDGAEDVPPPYWYNVSASQLIVYNTLNPLPLFAEGALKSHFSWHILSRGNAFDTFAPEVIKEATIKHPVAEAKYIANDFTSINFGWIEYSMGMQPDMLEFVCSKGAAWDSPVSLIAKTEQLSNHPRTTDNLEVLRRWENARLDKLLSPMQKQLLKNPKHEYTLLQNEKGMLELQSYRQIKNSRLDSMSIRAFTFNRLNKSYIVYWHTEGNGNLTINLPANKFNLFKSFDSKKSIISNYKPVKIPVNDRYYLETELPEAKLVSAFKQAKF